MAPAVTAAFGRLPRLLGRGPLVVALARVVAHGLVAVAVAPVVMAGPVAHMGVRGSVAGMGAPLMAR